MRTKNSDGSITEDCPKCGGSAFIRNKDTNRSEACENCENGQILIAPAGHAVTDESPVVVVEAKSFGGGHLRKGDEVLLHQGTDDPGKPVAVLDIDEATNTMTISSPIDPVKGDISFSPKPQTKVKK